MKISRSSTIWTSRRPSRLFPTPKPWPARENPALAAAMQALRAASLDVTIARQAYLPTLGVDFIYGIEANAFAPA